MPRIVLNALLVVLTLLAAAVIGAWLIGGVVSDRYRWSQWLEWIPTPAVLVAVVVGLLAALRPARRTAVRRRRLACWAAAAILIAGYFLFIEHHMLRVAPAEGQGLKLIHWSLGEPMGRQADSFARWIVSADADVTILTSAAGAPWHGSIRAWLGEDRRPLGMGPLAVLTRLPITQWRPLAADGDITIALLELDASARIGRALQIMVVDLPSDPKRARADVAAATRRLLEEAGASRADLVVGDFNIPRGSASLRRMFPDHRHAYDEAGHGYGATYHRRWPMYHIDHVLLADGLRCTRYDIVDPGLGRHRAEVAWITPAQ